MNYKRLLAAIAKLAKAGETAVELGRDGIRFVEDIKTALAGDVTDEKITELERRADEAHAAVQALPDDPGGDGGA